MSILKLYIIILLKNVYIDKNLEDALDNILTFKLDKLSLVQ